MRGDETVETLAEMTDGDRPSGAGVEDGTVEIDQGAAGIVGWDRAIPPGVRFAASRRRDEGPDGRYAIVNLRANCVFSSRNDFFDSFSAAVGCTLPLTSVTRDVSVCGPGVAPFHV